MTPEELKDALMRGHRLTPAELDAFIAANQVEGQLHDYKGGELTDKPNREKGLRTIREWVTGFANAEGGVLIIGPGDKRPHKITGCKKIGNEEVADWAQKALGDVVGMFSPAPRFSTVKHPDGEVLLIATERAPQLIPVIESRRWTYQLRINTSTVQVPDYLIYDLVLGRRKQPALEIRVSSCDWVNDPGMPALNVRRLALSLSIQNRSIVRAEKVQIGIVGWTVREPLRNDHILMYVDTSEPPNIDSRDVGVWSATFLVQRTGSDVAIPAFEQLDVDTFSGTLWVPCFTPLSENGEPFTFYRCAAFVASEASPPTWFQIDVTMVRSRGLEGVVGATVDVGCHRVPHGARPVVSCLLGDAARAAAKKPS
jgi:hypothetical protein